MAHPAARIACLVTLSLCACASLPGPPAIAQPDSAFVAVPGPPPPAHVEVVPPKPKTADAWIDGTWTWQGTRWRWADGGWVHVPSGAHYAWSQAKRREDGTLLYANPRWVGPTGEPLAPASPTTHVATNVDRTP